MMSLQMYNTLQSCKLFCVLQSCMCVDNIDLRDTFCVAHIFVLEQLFKSDNLILSFKCSLNR
jgi:hypothetical protein